MLLYDDEIELCSVCTVNTSTGVGSRLESIKN